MHVLGMSLSNQVAKNHIRAHNAVLEQRGEINDTKNSSERRKIFLDEGHLDCILWLTLPTQLIMGNGG